MAIAGTQQTEQERKLYTGLLDMEVVAFNPTHEKLKEITGNSEVKPPTYTGVSDDGNATLRVDAWLKNEEIGISTKLSIFLENKVVIGSNTGKTQYINQIAQTAWAMDEDGLDAFPWFRKEGIRKALSGEAALYEFIAAWTNIDQKADDADICLDTPTDEIIVKGDVDSLNDLIDIYDERMIRVLLGVRDDQYQDVYTRVFLKEKSNRVARLQKELTRTSTQGYPWRASYGNSLKFQPYTPSLDGPVDGPSAASASDLAAAGMSTDDFV